jgi:hypothetical protein
MLNVIYAECHNEPCMLIVMPNVVMLSVIMLSVIMLSVIMLSVIMLSVIMLSVIMLSVMAPVNGPMWLPYDNFRTILNCLSRCQWQD